MLVKKPPMGWNTWNTFGHDINEELIRSSADVFVEAGLRDAGYEYVVIDDCWSKKRDGDPRDRPPGRRNRKSFPVRHEGACRLRSQPRG